MAQVGVVMSGERKMIFETKVDTRKAIILTFIAFLFGGFQCAIYGMLTVPISEHFKITSSMIVFFDSFGLWGQIIAMAIGGFIISRIKGKNTLLLAAMIMVLGSVVSIIAPNIYIYTTMSFLCNMAIGFILVSCNYMIMGTVTEEGKSAGTLSILNVFFSPVFVTFYIFILYRQSRIRELNLGIPHAFSLVVHFYSFKSIPFAEFLSGSTDVKGFPHCGVVFY